MFFFRRRKRTKKSTAGDSCGKYLGSAYNELTQRTKPIHSPAVAHRIAAVSHRNALKVEKEREVGLSRDNRGGFLHYADASVEMTFVPERGV